MNVNFVRTLRTSTSERYVLAADDGTDLGAIDLHFLADGSVAGTITLLSEEHAGEAAVAVILARIDEVLLPMASLGEANLTFTVVVGRVVGSYQPQQ